MPNEGGYIRIEELEGVLCPLSLDEFMARVEIRENGCWEWRLSVMKARGGYGQKMLIIGGKRYLCRANRLAIWISEGTLPIGKSVCHKCNNPKCCNPAHLYVGTPSDNWRDARKAGTAHKLEVKRGQESTSCKIPELEIPGIRERLSRGESLAKIGREFGVTRQAIYRIKEGRSWKWLK